MKITIKNKLILCFSCVVLIGVVAQLVLPLFSDKMFESYIKSVMEDSFYEIKRSFDGTVESIESVIDKIEHDHNIRITISNSYEVIYINDEGSSLRGPIVNYLFTIPNINEYTESPKAISQYQNMPNDYFTKLSGLFYYEDEIIYINMSIPAQSIQSTASFFYDINIIISIFVLFVGLFLSLAISKSITKPIVDIEKISYDLANLNFKHFADEKINTTEIASLAKSINMMSQKLNASINELNEANAKLKHEAEYHKRLEEMRREFIANVSHEMKTPLSILSIYCQTLKEGINGIDKTYYYNTIIEEVERLDIMVKNMLDISAIENGFSKMQLEKLDFSEFTLREIGRIKPLLHDYDLKVMVEDNIIVKADTAYIDIAMKNYINNAISHTTKGEKIEISLKKEGSEAVFRVYNSGENIAEEQISFIWDSFYKLDKSRVRSDNNVGLGLYIVKTIIDGHFGKYDCTNKNNGVEFSFNIPLD